MESRGQGEQKSSRIKHITDYEGLKEELVENLEEHLPKLKEFDYANGHIYIVKEDMDIYKLLAGMVSGRPGDSHPELYIPLYVARETEFASHRTVIRNECTRWLGWFKHARRETALAKYKLAQWPRNGRQSRPVAPFNHLTVEQAEELFTLFKRFDLAWKDTMNEMRRAYRVMHEGNQDYAFCLSHPPAAEAEDDDAASVASFHTAHSHSLTKLGGRRSIANEGNIRRDQIYFG